MGGDGEGPGRRKVRGFKRARQGQEQCCVHAMLDLGKQTPVSFLQLHPEPRVPPPLPGKSSVLCVMECQALCWDGAGIVSNPHKALRAR